MIQESRIKIIVDAEGKSDLKAESGIGHGAVTTGGIEQSAVAESSKSIGLDNLGQSKFVLYWMQQSQRIRYNHALAAAIHYANVRKLPLVVFFALTDDYPEANLRHYAFMLEGITELSEKFKAMGIRFMILKGKAAEVIMPLMDAGAQALFMDKGYTRVQREWRRAVVKTVQDKMKQISGFEQSSLEGRTTVKSGGVTVFEVESDVVVPVEVASLKQEYGARTIRPKIQSVMDRYLVPLEMPKVLCSSLDFVLQIDDLSSLSVDEMLEKLNLDRSVTKSSQYLGGEDAAQKQLQEFIQNRLQYYHLSNHPEFNYCSDLSAYLHFGQISSLDIALQIRDFVLHRIEDGTAENEVVQPFVLGLFSTEKQIIDNVEDYLEQLIIRRELSMNYVYFDEEGYDKFGHITYDWAYKTMALHESDPRDYIYTQEQLEQSNTHDPYWNAANQEMVLTGKMHNYMRMYWCKKIIEWTAAYKEAYDTAVYLNNKYAIDGRDANSFTGIAWCFGRHDRAWTERQVFGKLRYMNEKGLERKFNMKAFLERVNAINNNRQG
jgi:deoxyribodipyrimidine photo-lyase